MQLIYSLGCIKYKLTPAEVLNAITINGAAAIELSDITGSIAKGKSADYIITKPIPSLAYIPYAFGSNKLDTLVLNGEIVYRN
jgi:imidazolonepropionase